MGEYRAIMTETDREYLATAPSQRGSKHYQAISRVRTRIREQLTQDVEVLRQHHPELFRELRSVVCEDTGVANSENDTIVVPVNVDRARLRDELPGTSDTIETRVDAILRMYELLRRQGEATREELLSIVHAEELGLADDESVWSNLIKGKDTLRVLPGVKSPGRGNAIWRFETPQQQPKYVLTEEGFEQTENPEEE